MTKKILVYKIARSSIDELDIDTPDFDAVTATLPLGLYTTFRTYAGRTKVIGLRQHLERLYLPAKVKDVVPAVRRASDFRDVLAELLTRFDVPEARVRLVLDASVEPGSIYVLLQSLQTPPPEIYRDGVRLEISRSSRTKPSLKQTAFISESAFERKRIGGEIYEILLTDKGRILEGMTSNFFYFREGVLCTAGRGVLIGVTRQTVLALAKQDRIKTCIKALRINEIPAAEETFITSSSRGIVPVIQIDAHVIADGKVGERTKNLMRLYERNVLAMAEDIV